VQQIAVEDQDAQAAKASARRGNGWCAGPPGPLIRWRAMFVRQKYRMRTPSTGREILVEAEPGKVYRDRDTGEELEVIAKTLPLAPDRSQLPWAVENLRFCNWCDQMAQKDLNDCPTCGRRMAAIDR
jgi:hypothetical protein